MKLYYALALMSLSLLCCKEDADSPDTGGIKLKSIVTDYQGQDGTITFDYDTGDYLTQVEEHFSGKRIEFSYSNNTLEKILTFNQQGELKSLDSISYFPNGRIEKLYRFFADENGQLKESSIYEYLYNHQDLVDRVNYYYDSSAIFTGYTTYEWSNGNITQIHDFQGNGDLILDVMLEYDHKLNFKKDNPYFYFEPLNTTVSNVVLSSVTDHTGLYDPYCNPCSTSYAYNTRDYPIRVKYHYGAEQIINYR